MKKVTKNEYALLDIITLILGIVYLGVSVLLGIWLWKILIQAIF